MKCLSTLAALSLAVGAQPAAAQIAAEAMVLKAEGDGKLYTQLGAGYDFRMAGFRLSPMVAAITNDDGLRFFGRGEVAYSIPLIAEVGAGVRFNADYQRGYLTAAVPVFPMIRLKGNLGKDFFELGARVSF